MSQLEIINSNESYISYCKDFAINRLAALKGQIIAANRLCYAITDVLEQQCDIPKDRQESRALFDKLIGPWWDAAADLVNSQLKNGMVIDVNPFDNPEGFRNFMVSQGIISIFIKSPIIRALCEEKIELHDEMIGLIRHEIRAAKHIVL